MEFIKVGKKWLIKDSNGVLVSNDEKIRLENEEMVVKAEPCKECEIKPVKKKNKKTAPIKEVVADDIIEETDIVI